MKRTLSGLIEDKNIIFVDCFDTLVYRKCSSEFVLNSWFDQIAEEYDIDYSQVKEMWALAIKTNNKMREELSFKTVAYSLFNRAQYIQKELINFDKFYTYLLNSYVRIESDVLVVNKNLISVLKNAKEKGKKIYLVSDFYMPKEFFERIFLKFDVIEVFNEMYVSSDVGYRKSSGKMYDWLLKKMNLNAQDILMIGDNNISDCKRPEEKGISAYRIKIDHSKFDKTINHKLMEIFEKQYKENPLSNYAFSLYLFMVELIHYVKNNNVKTLYFCSREGEFFKEIFDLLINQNGLDIKTQYLLVSRKSTFLPSLNKNIESEEFLTLKKSSDSLSLSDFIATLGLKNEDYSLNKQVDMEKVISNFWKSKEFKSLKGDSMFSSRYEKAVNTEKKEFKKYLEKIGISEYDNNLTIVDIGWKGTIQDNLFNYFDGKMKIDGLYYGIEGDVDTCFKNRKYGLVYSEVPIRNKYFSIYSTNHRMLERLLQASHGTANYYFDGDCILAELGVEEKRLYELMQQNKKCIRGTIFTLNKMFNEVTLSKIQLKELIAFLHETYLICYSRKLYSEERNLSNLMLMTFGTKSTEVCYLDILKSVIKMSKVEKRNKFLKILRRVHFNLIGDVIVNLIFLFRKKSFLKWSFK